MTPNDRHTENGKIDKSMNEVPECTGMLKPPCMEPAQCSVAGIPFRLCNDKRNVVLRLRYHIRSGRKEPGLPILSLVPATQ